MNIVGIAVVDAGVPVVVGGGGDPGGDVLLLQLSLDPQRLHLVHLRDTLAEVFNELGSEQKKTSINIPTRLGYARQK